MFNRFNRVGSWVLVFGFALVLGTGPAYAQSVIDLEGLDAGLVVSSLSSGNGISGAAVSGSVSVFGDSNRAAIPTNAAVIFDATCPGGCSGNDNDLEAPNLGNVLIIAEDLVDDSPADGLIDDPDDADKSGQNFQFDFSGFGPGTVTVSSITILDVEGVEFGGFIELFSGGPGGTLLAPGIPIPVTGNGNQAVVPVNVANVDFMKVTMLGSGAIDNIQLDTDGFCGDDVKDPTNNEQCDGTDDSMCPGQCDDECMCPEEVCGNNVVDRPEEECDGTAADQCRNNLCRPDCTCVPIIFNDPARVTFDKRGNLDVFSGFGVITPEKNPALLGSTMTLRLTNGSGAVVYETTIQAGACEVGPNGKRCRYRDRSAKDLGGLEKLGLKQSRRGYRVEWRAWDDDMSNADGEMTVHFILNGREWATKADWRERRNGWKGRFPNR